ncbi:hypothetical protein ACFFR3_28205 [Nonomuraea salmonea]|uniref:DUF5666 domain-containing protein n=1 Tax=Nonomuraea salmonea TaxID=46181 RepID=A0ABV5NSX8_9ACTN
MPRRADGPPPRAPQSEPFETTGAFAVPTNDPAGAYPQQPRRDPRMDPGLDPGMDDAGPFETTGAFARPQEWNQPPDQTAVFGGPGGTQQFPGQGDALFDPPAEQRGLFDPPAGRRGSFDDHPGAFDDQREPFDGRRMQFEDERDRFDAPAGPQGPFNGPEQRGPFDGPGDQRGPFNDQPGPFDGPADPHDPFGSSPFDDAPDSRTARFDPPPGSGVPPEPGDVKVAGEPTAMLAPAWANAETGFLGPDNGSGWPDDADEPRTRRGRRKGRGGGGGGDDDVLAAAPSGAGKGRVALLSVAAVAVVLGGTVAGVKFMSSSGDPAKCEGTSCAAVQAPSQKPAPAGSGPVDEESEPEPEDEPVEEETAADEEPSSRPTPTATSNVGAPRRTATPTPTPTKTRVKKQEKPVDEPAADPSAEAEETVSEAPSEQPSTLDDADTGTGVVPDESTPPANDSGIDSPLTNTGALNVRQTIKQRLTTYQANLTLSNDSVQPLRSPTVSVPVDGKVVKVEGATWTQDGDLLILDVSTTLASGDSVEVSFTATGRGSKAKNCGVVAGQCAIS